MPFNGEHIPFCGTGDGVSVGVGSIVLVSVGGKVSVIVGEGIASTDNGGVEDT